MPPTKTDHVRGTDAVPSINRDAVALRLLEANSRFAIEGHFTRDHVVQMCFDVADAYIDRCHSPQ